MKILLHICCAPCAIYPIEVLARKSEYDVTGFFYNPNIYPVEEYEKRRQAVVEYSEKNNFNTVVDEYKPEEFSKKIGECLESPARCGFCWQMRLERTSEAAKFHKFDAFTTTLLVSPYQNRDAIVQIGNKIGEKSGIEFVSIDFREGFRKAQQHAREMGIYRQKYCGCVYSQKRHK